VLITAALLLTVVTVAVGLTATSPPSEMPAPVAPSVAAARGQVRPSDQAQIGTLSGGVIVRLAVKVGDEVGEQQEIARLRPATDGAAEVLTAPHAGTVVSLPVHAGDTVMPGSVVATVGNVRRLQVETTDVDEFLIVHAAVGRPVTMTVAALDRRELRGVIRAVALQPERSADGDDNYPVTIDLLDQPADLRVGMTVRVILGE
jgi:multidrug efflux pump subunit AcrA (membrane-fusion protein)